jgi:hypothetical protein
MRTIETVITVLADGSIQVPRNLGLPPGAHRAVLVVEEHRAQAPSQQPLLTLKMLDWSGWPADATYRREEVYDDTGR